MHVRARWTLILAAASVLACVFAVGCKGKSNGDIVVGSFLSMSGGTADFGTESKRGFDMAFEAANAAGGIKGRRLRLENLDDQGKAEEAGSAVNRLIDRNGAVAILGEVASSLSLVGGRIAQRRGVPMISPSSTNTQVTAIGDNVFRVCFIDPFQGYAMARFARETLHLQNVAIFTDVRSDYSKGLAESFRNEFTHAGGRIGVEQSYSQGDTDFGAQLTAIQAANVQAIFVPGYYQEVGNIARQARRLGLNVPLLGGDGWDSPQLRSIGGHDIEGSYYSNHFAPDNPTPRGRAFIEEFRRRYHQAPTSLAAQAFDAANILFDAMRRAPEITPAAIRTQLAATRNFPGVTGVISMDANRNSIKPAVVLRVGPTGDVFETTIEPR